jgi:hypothetical protein
MPLPPPGAPGGGGGGKGPAGKKGPAPKGPVAKGVAPPPVGVPDVPLFGGAPNPADAQRLRAELGKKLVGTWRADLGNGAVQVIEYRADGTFKDSLTGASGGRETSGSYQIAGLIGTRGLRLDRPIGSRNQVEAIFEGDELIHDTDDPAVSGVFRRQQ